MGQVKLKSTVTLRAKAQCPSHARTDIKIRDLNFTVDEPVVRGGTNAGPTPTDTAIAALVARTTVIGSRSAASLGVDFGHSTIGAVCEFDRRGVTLEEEIDVPFGSITLDVRADGPADQTALDRIAQETEKFCPLSKLFQQAGTKLEVNWSKLSATGIII